MTIEKAIEEVKVVVLRKFEFKIIMKLALKSFQHSDTEVLTDGFLLLISTSGRKFKTETFIIDVMNVVLQEYDF